jgi:sulfite reductase beta subunit-like hemoprotein
MILNLPRKFKISFSGCRLGCGKAWINDLGFIAQRDGLFTVIGAGSLGAKPALGIELYKNLPAKDVLALCISAIEFFKDHGNRENRHRARFRHVREKYGDDAFRAELDLRFNRLKVCRNWPDFLPAKGDRNIKLLWRLQLPNGNIASKDAVELADIAEGEESLLRINLEHGLELYGTKAFQLPDHLAALEKNPVIVSCPGCSTCSRAIAECWALADGIRNILAGQEHSRIHINISGCPNNCAHSTVSEIGLVGMRRKQNGINGECYRLYKGGGEGKSNRLAQKCEILSAKDAPKAVASIIESAGV